MFLYNDNLIERTLIKETLPEVTVPEFPTHPEELVVFMINIYRLYFEKLVITDGDRNKAEQYLANRKRNNLLKKSIDFDGYLIV